MNPKPLKVQRLRNDCFGRSDYFFFVIPLSLASYSLKSQRIINETAPRLSEIFPLSALCNHSQSVSQPASQSFIQSFIQPAYGSKVVKRLVKLTQHVMKLTGHRGHGSGWEAVDVECPHLVDLCGREGHARRQVASVAGRHDGRLLLHELLKTGREREGETE